MDKLLLQAFDRQQDVVKRKWLTATLTRQLAEQNVEKPKMVEAMVDLLMAGGNTDTFAWRDGDDEAGEGVEPGDEPVRTLKLGISPADIAEFDRMQKDAIRALPGIIGDATKATAKSVLRRLLKDWPEAAEQRQLECDAFLFAHATWWEDALEQLRMLQVMAVEEAQGEARRIQKSRAKTNLAKRDVQFRLHVRICQVGDEILTLLENGFADGAMARWRTLHELVVVALLIYDHDDDLAQRYLDHEVVEAWNAAVMYQEVRVPYGDKPYSAKDMAAFTADRQAMLDKYGKSFGGEYGWAAHHLGVKAPSLKTLETAAGRVALRSHYKMASYNVHAGPKGIAFRHGAGDNPAANLAGRSMYGLEEPGCNTAFALAQAAILFVEARKGIAHQVRGWTIVMLRDSVCRAFVKAGKAVRAA
ncbi:MAG: hypothetical protein JHD15_03930 [Phenylobacterium sp.]|uniref:DUF5677 domain-containing protein n=1 Tax=Phenylobacterium sp. TaxID=1871053 RepID=UPI001A249E3E|nr:DUF5677 domain-containing protein [Phenylobacterium sp.]MBJ7409499.1 hypothetical protein [Phenylobacterium sp.]